MGYCHCRIMKATIPLDCLKVGYDLNAKMDIDAWHNGPAQIAMDKGLKSKFEKNTHLKIFLLSTGNKTLVEQSQRIYIGDVVLHSKTSQIVGHQQLAWKK